MKTLVLLIVLSVSAFGQFTIKGHVLGEPMSETLSKAGDPNAVADCQTFLQKNKVKNNAFLSPKEMDRNSQVIRCQAVVMSSSGAPAEFFVRGVGTAHFRDQKLVGLEISFWNALEDSQHQVAYDDVISDATARYGKPTEEGTTTLQNAFGATWHPRYAVWLTKDLTLRISESPERSGNYQPDITLTAYQNSELEQKAKERKSTAPSDLFK